jgi:hypothetical protein
MASDPETLAELDEAATNLLLLYEAEGVTAVILTLTDTALYARCQVASDVVPMCKKVLQAHEAPGDRTLQ